MGVGVAFESCCGRWSAGNAPDPESLMRSRYSAFVRQDGDYLLKTWYPSTRPALLNFDETPAPQWFRLDIRQAPPPDGTSGIVEFVAHYKQGGRAFRLHEISRFILESGRWYYLDGEMF